MSFERVAMGSRASTTEIWSISSGVITYTPPLVMTWAPPAVASIILPADSRSRSNSGTMWMPESVPMAPTRSPRCVLPSAVVTSMPTPPTEPGMGDGVTWQVAPLS